MLHDDAGKSTDKEQEFRYNGERQDETGNIYLRARYYNPRIGQFIQIDSYRGEEEDVTSQGRYTYALNNQYKYVDRDGNFAIAIAITASAYAMYKINKKANSAEAKKDVNNSKITLQKRVRSF